MRLLPAFAAAFTLVFAGAALAQPLRTSTVEPGVYIEFGPSFLDYQNIDSAGRCRELCEKEARCRVWRYVSGTAPAEYGRARRLCVLSERRPISRTKPGLWATSGEVK
ncbi:MAG: hypothetical protein KIT16_21540 [Rhodospirillaceae bacterium]|nr:hypothetical protein [Rhodospirillaceae bacterium]